MYESELRTDHHQSENISNLDNSIDTGYSPSISNSDVQFSSNYGVISKIADNYESESDRLLGYLLKFGYKELEIQTCDPWKYKCGGISRNSFIIVKSRESQLDSSEKKVSKRIVLARVTDSIPTPLEGDLRITLFETHKSQVYPDPYTKIEFQFGALKASILGTFYDKNEDEIGFGNDVTNFFGAYAYEVYIPTSKHLEILINSFIDTEAPLAIGNLRYTETPNESSDMKVNINVNPKDFIGSSYGQRTALFGKTRYGKSNTIKVIADSIMSTNTPPGQIIFDPSGEYTYWNEQDSGSLFIKHGSNSIRYSINPVESAEEKKLNLNSPKLLKIDFYNNVVVGLNIINQLWDSINQGNKPGYFTPILEWDAKDPIDAPPRTEYSEFEHFWRTLSLWYGVLKLAGFTPNQNSNTRVQFNAEVKNALLENSNVSCKTNSYGEFDNDQPIENLPSIYKAVAEMVNDPNFVYIDLEYFNDVEQKLLSILKRSPTITGHNYIRPFARFHDPDGSSIFEDISRHAIEGKSVFIEMAQANETVRGVLSENICKHLLKNVMEKFTDGTLGDKFIILYFEEAHTLFEKDDKDLNSIYNKLAKEGAKFHISMIYATQSMTTLSPDLLKNTENFIVAHLDDDREVKELSRKYDFKDLAEDLPRMRSKGFVRMVTSSHMFALPVQIKKFEM